ncbi:ABC transporter substrate-binding protein [Ideonella sp. A 288]|uniref:ABC transporter substrate-binding protein n=1 Tax=Ideonella sp. A 288 TaxID=1962181 RepID=UPI000B4ACF8B|nr:ABC transporter substrate-binding protein [Ideonella sp. A 288]
MQPKEIRRRGALQRLGAVVVAASGLGGADAALAQAKPIVIGLPIAQSGPAGVADHADYLNGAKLAAKELNAAGGVKGRPIELKVFDIDIMTPEGTQATFRKMADAKVHAIASPFVLIPIPAMEAVANYKAPYLNGNTSIAGMEHRRKNDKKLAHVFHIDPAETFYGAGFPIFLEQLQASGAWKPVNNKVHIVTEQLAYTQTITKTAQEHFKKRGKYEVVKVTDIQFPVQDWGPVLQDIKKTGAGILMINHWVAAELAAFAKQFSANPLPGALVYLQYGPSQPEFLTLAGPAAEGFVWGTVYGAYADKQGTAFRDKYKAEYLGKGGSTGNVMGMVYTGGGYDTVKLLAKAWGTAEPEKFEAVNDTIRKMTYRGVNGFYRFDNPLQAPLHYPLETTKLEEGVAHLFFQVQGGAHRIISPDTLKEVGFKGAPWMK